MRPVKTYLVIYRCSWTSAFLSLLAFSSSSLASSVPVRHLVGIHDTPYSNMTGGICPYLYSTTVGAVCSLNQSTGQDAAKIELDVIGKFDELAYEDFHKLETKPTEDLVQKIFAERKFNSASGIATLSSYFNRSHISFTPLRLVQAYYLTNPVFPEVHYVRAMDSIFTVQHTFHFDVNRLSDSFRTGQFMFSVKPWILQRNRQYLDADLTDVITAKKKERKSTSIHEDLSLAARYVPGTPWFRGITVAAHNLNGEKKCAECDDHTLNIDDDTRRRFQVSVDFGGSFPVGAFILGAGVETQTEENAGTPAKLNLSAVYKLTSFGFYSSFNESITRLGFLYEGSLYKSGIIYTNEKQVNTLRFERKNEAFLVFGCSL